MAESERAILTVLCMVYQGSKILLQDRVKADWRGLTFPGGHVEKGEPFVEAVIREINEETGLAIHSPQLCGTKQFPTPKGERYVVLLFKTGRFSGELRSSQEGEMVWVDRNDLPAAAVAEGFYDLLRVFDDTETTELFYEQDQAQGEWTARLL